MMSVTASSQLQLAGEPCFRQCTTVAQLSPDALLTSSIAVKSPIYGRLILQSVTAAVDPTPHHADQRIFCPRRCPVKSHRRRTPTRRPAGSFLGGFRTPALRAPANSCDGPESETLHRSSRRVDGQH
jgi:hypothetical protein